MLTVGTWTDAQMCNDNGTGDSLSSSRLEPPETSSDSDQEPLGAAAYLTEGLAERFRHSGWQRNRHLVYLSLRRTMQSIGRIVAFDSCGATAFVYRSVDEPIEYRLGGSSCRDRFCLPCAKDRSRCLATNVIREVGDRQARFVTLTLLQNGITIGDYIDKLYASFRKLRETKFWKKHVRGGCSFLEIKYKPQVDDWNVHLHLVTHGTWMDKRELSRAWHKATGDSYVTDIKFIEDLNKIGQYVVKYASKPFNNTFLARNQQLDDVVQSLRGRRLCLTFGDWRGLKLTESPNPRDWISLGDFHDVASRAINGEHECLEAIQAICREDAEDILGAVRMARPPPDKPKPPDAQLTFAWPSIDDRF